MGKTKHGREPTRDELVAALRKVALDRSGSPDMGATIPGVRHTVCGAWVDGAGLEESQPVHAEGCPVPALFSDMPQVERSKGVPLAKLVDWVEERYGFTGGLGE